MSDLTSRFDYYSATFPDGFGKCSVDVLKHLGDGPPRKSRGVYGYNRGWQIVRDGDVVVTCQEAPNRPDYVFTAGGYSPEVATVLRRAVRDHTVPRLDVCVDFGGGDAAFSDTRSQVFGLLSGKVTLTDYVSHGLDGAPAASLLFGKRKNSEAYGRMYRAGLVHEELVRETNRMELECKPAKPDRRRHLATLEPWEVWGWARWSRTLADNLFGLWAPAAPPRSARLSDRERSLNALAAQWNRVLWELVEYHGGDVDTAFLDLLNRTNGPSW